MVYLRERRVRNFVCVICGSMKREQPFRVMDEDFNSQAPVCGKCVTEVRDGTLPGTSEVKE
jgi:hypothetical protein